MSIQKYRTSKGRALTGFAALALLSLLTLFSAGCNQDGVGIFYSISQEEKQITSRISEVDVYQVVEAEGELYALGGRSVWKQSGDNWNSLGGGYAYNIVGDATDLYAYFNNDDDDLDDGKIMRFTGSAWEQEDSFSDDGKLMDIGDDTFALKLNAGTLHIKKPLSDISEQTSVSSDSIVGGTYVSTLTPPHYLISDSTVYSWNGTALDDSGFTSPPEKNGDFAAITSNGTTDTLYLVTTSGQVFSSGDGTDWTYRNSVDGSVDADYGAASVVDISGTDHLMIGTDDGYYQMELSGYTFTETPDDYEASYPELGSALVYQVYQTTNADEDIYLATQNGLWKRTGPTEFERQ